MPAPLANLFNYAYMHTQDPSRSVQDPAIQALIDQGILTKEEVSPERTISGQGGVENVAADYLYNIDPTKVPTTKYGDITSIRPAQFGDFKLKNPALQYDDPNYGAITPMQNTIDPSKQRNLYDLIGPIYSAILTAGVGAPWFMSAGLSAAKMLGTGDFNALNLAGSAIPGLGDLGIPAEAIQALQAAKTGYGIYSALDDRGGQPSAAPATPAAAAPAAQPVDQPIFPTSYNPALFGDFGSMIAPSDGTSMVASSVAPSAYNNSYEANSQLIS